MATCNACNIVFTPDEIRAHYATPLHNANLKRRVAELPPVTPAAFARLTAEAGARDAARAASAVLEAEWEVSS